MKRALCMTVVGIAFGLPASANAGCNSKACEKRVYTKMRKKVIKPYVPWLGTTGRCESGTTTNLHHGLRAISPGGKYRGRYQFDFRSWNEAGGHGDPANASWLEQAYRAVKLRVIGGTGRWPICGR